MDFYRRVLPACGPFTLLTGVYGPDGALAEQRHYNGLKSHAEVEELVQRLSMMPLNVFYAVGSYGARNRQEPVAKRCLYLDLDSKDFEGSVEIALRELSVFVRSLCLPRPSLYVHSGRGVHVYWCLNEDVPIDRWLPVAKALKQKCIDLDFHADKACTTDVARVLRVPGTLNRKGAEPLPCRVLSDNGTEYSLEEISNVLGIKHSSAMERLASLSRVEDIKTKRDLRKFTSDEVLDMLDCVQLPSIQGRYDWIAVLNAVQDWSDKSEEGFQIFHEWSASQPNYEGEEDCRKTWNSFNPGGGIGVGTLVKMATDGGWISPDKEREVLPVITPDSLVTPLTQDQSLAQQLAEPIQPSAYSPPMIGSGVIASALMITAANAIKLYGKPRFDKNDAVQWLSNEFVLVTNQDGIFYSLSNREAMERAVINDLLTRYMPYNANGIPIEACTLLRRYGTVHSVNALGFHPGASSIYMEHGRSYVNQYISPPPTVPMTHAEIALMNDFWWNYIFPRPGDRQFGEYLMQCYAHLVQKPSIKIASAALMVSEKFGTGKTTIMYEIPKALAGTHVTKIVSNKVLKSQFSDYVNGSHFLHFDEVHINGRWDSEDNANAMKNLVTGTEVEVHPKGMKSFYIPNRLFITATSNYKTAISMPSDDERRWGVYYLLPLRVWMSEAQKVSYFNAMHNLINGTQGPGKLRWYFAQVNISNFNPQATPPMTDAKRAMVEQSQSIEVRVIQDAYESKTGPFSRELFTTDEIRVLLYTQLSKSYSNVQVKEYIGTAIKESWIVTQLRVGGDIHRVWAVANHQKWAQASALEIRDFLRSPQQPQP